MVNTVINNEANLNFSEKTYNILFILSGVFLCIVGLTIFQDFLESKRNSYTFYFKESILFKIIWFLFIPILAVLYQQLKEETMNSYGKTVVFIVLPILVHILVLPIISVVFSVLFYEGRYDMYKFFSYTLAHDFYKLAIVYTGFVIGYKYFASRPNNTYITESKPTMNTMVINNGKENVVVHIAEIIQITSATPYVFIHLENKKYLHSETLKSMCTQLDNNIFVRIHKSTVVNILKVTSYRSRLNGDFDLKLTYGELVRLSRTYAADFKNHFKASPQVNI